MIMAIVVGAIIIETLAVNFLQTNENERNNIYSLSLRLHCLESLGTMASLYGCHKSPSSERSSGLTSVNKVFFLFLLGIDFVSGFILCSLETQYEGLDIDNLQNLECCLVFLFPYFLYMRTEGVGLSDIVSILFAGIVMKHYTYSNLSENSQRFVSAFFHLISSLAETFLYIQGFDIAMEQHSWSHVGFIFFLIIFIVAANVFSCGYLVNLARPMHRKIPPNHLKALWYSEITHYTLALQSIHDLPEGHGQTIFTATTTIVVLTVLLIGGLTSTILEALHVVGDGHDGQLGESFEGNHGYLVLSQSFEESHGYLVPPFDEKPSSGNIIKLKLKEFHKRKFGHHEKNVFNNKILQKVVAPGHTIEFAPVFSLFYNIFQIQFLS
ncbi:hypothetical protein UlMin_040672 [Ulmus minor]